MVHIYRKICIYLSYLLQDFGHASQPPLEVTYIHILDVKAITQSFGNHRTGDIKSHLRIGFLAPLGKGYRGSPRLSLDVALGQPSLGWKEDTEVAPVYL